MKLLCYIKYNIKTYLVNNESETRVMCKRCGKDFED